MNNPTRPYSLCGKAGDRAIIIFDLDGTLTDTLEDLWISTNHALGVMGYPLRSIDEVRRFVGNGVGKLIERAVPEGTAKEQELKCLDAFRAHYVEHCQDHTSLYPGVREMLMALRQRGYQMAVVSNKLQAGVSELEKSLFPDIFQLALGEGPGLRRKPAPDMLLHAMQQLGGTPAQTLYVGDSDVDLETARNAGVDCVSVLWGFRDLDFLLQHGASITIQQPMELLELLNR